MPTIHLRITEKLDKQFIRLWEVAPDLAGDFPQSILTAITLLAEERETRRLKLSGLPQGEPITAAVQQTEEIEEETTSAADEDWDL